MNNWSNGKTETIKNPEEATLTSSHPGPSLRVLAHPSLRQLQRPSVARKKAEVAHPSQFEQEPLLVSEIRTLPRTTSSASPARAQNDIYFILDPGLQCLEVWAILAVL